MIPVFYEGHIKKMEPCLTELFIYVISKVKPLMKNKCFNVTVKVLRGSEDIIAAAFTFPAGSSVTCLRQCNHLGAISLALED